MNDGFEKFIQDYLNSFKDSRIKEAMIYMMEGGKRIRPLIIFSIVKGFGINEEEAYEAALALEMIQTYSLIHDDLPAMDNDDYRRGKLSCHKAFREDVAILTGDALLTHSFGVIADSHYDLETKVKMISVLSAYAGMDGMIYGQLLDCTEEVSHDENGLVLIQENKTGGLFKIACLFAGYIAKSDEHKLFTQLGSKIGLIFQNQDDLFDAIRTSEEQGKSLSEKDEEKFTALKIYSIDELSDLIDREFDELNDITGKLNFDTSYLNEILMKIRKR